MMNAVILKMTIMISASMIIKLPRAIFRPMTATKNCHSEYKYQSLCQVHLVQAFFIFLGGGGLKFALSCKKRFRRGRNTKDTLIKSSQTEEKVV